MARGRRDGEEARVRRFVPDVRTVDLEDPYAGLDPPADGWAALGMVTSVDGAVTIDGVSRGLGSAGDMAAFRALRALADVVVVGAGTVVAEDYGSRVDGRHSEARARRGQAPRPRLALVTGRGRLDATARVFAARDDGDARPLVLTTTAGAVELAARGVDAEIVALGGGSTVRPRAAVGFLRDRGLSRIVLEGGPTLNASWLGAGVVDELFVTIAPTLVGTAGPGIAGELEHGPMALELIELREHAGELVLRYRIGPAGYRRAGDDAG